MKLRRSVFVRMALGLSALALAATGAGAGPATRRVTFGVLLDLSGELADAAPARKAALALGLRDANAEMEALGAPVRFGLTIADTQLSPHGANKKLRSLYNAGIRTVIGPMTSAELAVIGPFANSRNLLVISPESTASALAQPDHLFRFCPSDVSGGEALAALMKADGIGKVVPLWRNDAGNSGWVNSTLAAFQARGGKVFGGSSYEPDTTDFSSHVATVEARVQAAQGDPAAGQTAVLLSSFDETIEIMHAAAASPVLSGVKWYGTDGVVQSPALAADAQAAAFANQVGFPTTAFGLDPAARSLYEPISASIFKRVGVQPDAFSLAYYDTVRVAAKAVALVPQSAAVSRRLQALRLAADHYFGATGWTALNAAGDRRISNYDFFGLRPKDGGGFEWARVAQYLDGNLVRSE